MKTPYDRQELGEIVESLNAECRALRKEIADLERAHQETEALAAENKQLRQDTQALRLEFAQVVTLGSRICEKRHAMRLIEIYKKDLEQLRKPAPDG